MAYNQLSDNELKVEELRLNVLKNISTLQLTSAGGILTIAKAFIPEAESHLLVYLAVGLLLFSSMITLSISESIIRRIGPQPTHGFLLKLVSLFPSSVNSEYNRSMISGTFLALGFLLFFMFLLEYGK